MASLLVEAASKFIVDGTIEGGVVSTEQAFDRMVKEYEFAMEQQRLKREDIRDLVELTVGRMDVYHLVGALLLEFCIHFYVENKLVEDSEVPHWVLNLFLISNVGAVGFLLFAVWLSMHASVAAHSVGVRLLLNYARVTTPDPEELKKIQKARTLFSQVKKRVSSALRMDPDPVESRSKGQDSRSPPLPSPDPSFESRSFGPAAPSSAPMSSIDNPSRRSSGGHSAVPTPKVLSRPGSVASIGGTFSSAHGRLSRQESRLSSSPPPPHSRQLTSSLVANTRRSPSPTLHRASPGNQVTFIGADAPRNSTHADAPRNANRSFLSVQSGQTSNAFGDHDDAFGIASSRTNAFNLLEHKETFQRQQAKWLSYDAYARTVMAVGINQMLQALSYYIVGVVSRGSPTGAVASLVAVQMLSLLLLRLDVSDEGTQGKLCEGMKDIVIVLCLGPFPPIFAGCFVWLEKLPSYRNYMTNHYAAWVTPCFVLHFFWLLYLRHAMQPNDDMVPPRLRTVCYLDVLEKTQCDLAHDEPWKKIDELKAALQSLRDGVEEVHKNESQLAGTWTEIQYSDHYGEQLRQRLGRDVQRDDVVKTAIDGEILFHQFVEFRGTELQRRFPIQIKVKDQWIEIHYSSRYREQLRLYLGRDMQDNDVVKTAIDGEILFRRLKEFSEEDLQRRFPIQIKVKDPHGEALTMSATLRAEQHLQDRQTEIQALVEEVQAIDGVPASVDVVLEAQLLLRLFDLWRQVPTLRARLVALRATEAFGWMGEGEDRLDEIDRRIAQFKRFCSDFLDKVFPPTASTRGVRTSSVDTGTLSASAIVSHVAVDYDDPDTVFVNIQTGKHEDVKGRPEAFPEVRVENAVEMSTRCGDWLELAEQVRHEVDTTNYLPQNVHHPPVAVERRRFRDRLFGRKRRETMEIPEKAKPPKALPWLIVKKYTSTVCFVWIIGCVHHITRCLNIGSIRPVVNVTSVMEASWPKPAGLFKITGLFCNDTHVMVSSQFSLYAAARLSDAMLGDLLEIGSAERTAVSCTVDGQGCHALSLSENGDEWLLSSVASSLGIAERAPIPSWPRVSFSWSQCKPAGCQAAWVAGWDGAKSVILATLHRDSSDDLWNFKRRFTVEPSRNRCIGLELACEQHSEDAYRNVRGLHLGDSGKTLLVLHDGGLIDAWDLDEGMYFNRFHFHPEHSSICHDGQNILIGRSTPTGPVLETSPLPNPFDVDIEAVEQQVATYFRQSFEGFLAKVSPLSHRLITM